MVVTPEWRRAHAALGKDIARAAKRDGKRFKDVTDLVNTSERYPSVVPVLVDWLRNVESKSGLTGRLDLSNFREALARALTTIDAMGTDAVSVLFDQYQLAPQLTPGTVGAVSNALAYLAVPSDYNRIAKLATDRSLGIGRAMLFEWLVAQGGSEALQIVIDQLDGPSVSAYALRDIRSYKPLPTGLRPTVTPYLDDPDSEVRKQAKLLLKKLPD